MPTPATASLTRRHAMRFATLVLAALVAPAFSGVAEAAPVGAIVGTVSGSKDSVVLFLDGARIKDAAHKHQIVQKNLQFNTKLLVIGTGDSVSFPNGDRVSHNVFSLSRTRKFDFGIYPPGSNKTIEFPDPGLVDVFCSIHQEMHTTIAVVSSDYYATSDSKGQFKISDVPPGKYTLVVWRKGKEVSRKAVTVGGGADTSFDVDLK